MKKNKKNKTNNVETEKTKKYKVKASKKEKKNKKKHPKLKKVLLILFILVFLLCLIGAGAVVGIFFSDKFKLTEEDLTGFGVNSVAKDKDGNVIATISGEINRKIVSFDEMPDNLKNAFVAIEDKRFYTRQGEIDIKRTAYATIMYIFNKGDASAGGGSTITQQLIKNLKEDDARDGAAGIERKIREMARAYNIGKMLSKQQILELYLNIIPMGSTIGGVGMAAEYYFNKPVTELDLAECAFLAGINHSPSKYNPFTGADNSSSIISRTKEVLKQMKEQKMIENEETYNAAVAKVEAGLPFQKGANVSAANYSYHTAAAINQVVEDLMKEKGLSKEAAQFMVENKGYVIYTTQDTNVQARMEEEFKKDKYVKSGQKKNKDGTLLNTHTQAGMAIIDQKTGQVVGICGALGTDSNTTGVNRALRLKQTGSSIKPLVCEAPALEKGIINSATVYDDSLTKFSASYTPHNSEGHGFSGLITIRTALAESSNIVHLKILKELGVANGIDFLKTIGIELDKEKLKDDITVALGSGSVTPLNMAGAYAAIANNGVYITPTFYTKVEDSNGNVVLEAKQEKRQVMSEANAYILQDLLTAPVKSGGTATGCSIANMDVAAKTGSTNNYIDRWLCGFTPYYTGACWFGFDYSETPVFRGNTALKIWAAIMKDIHKDLPSARFQKPKNIVTATICQDSGCLATDSCSRTTTEIFVANSVPEECEGHQKLLICPDSGKIANQYCTNAEEKTFLVKPEKENTNLWKTEDGGKYDVPTETCDVHVEPEKVEVIDVIGNTLQEAKEKLEKIGLKVSVKYEQNKNKKEGIVLEQSIKKGEKVEKETNIVLTINKIEKNNEKPNENTTTNEVNTNTAENTVTNTTDNTTTTNTIEQNIITNNIN